MANEITTSVLVQVLKPSIYLAETVNTSNLQQDMSGSHIHHEVYDLTTSWASIGKGGVVNMGVCVIRNTTAAGVVQVSFDAGTTSHLTIPAGKAVLLHLTPGQTVTDIQLKVTASTGTARVLIVEA